VGGGGTQTAAAGGLKVLAPRKLNRKKAKRRLPLVLNASSLGKASITLRKGSRRIAAGEVVFTKTGEIGFVLRLPKNLKAGRYKIVVVFTPATGPKKTTTLKLTVR
jgi:hypothetical protein